MIACAKKKGVCVKSLDLNMERAASRYLDRSLFLGSSSSFVDAILNDRSTGRLVFNSLASDRI